MEPGAIALWSILFWQVTSASGEFLEAYARSHQFGMDHDTTLSQFMRILLSLRRLSVADKPGPRNVDVYTITTNQVGIVSEDF